MGRFGDPYRSVFSRSSPYRRVNALCHGEAVAKLAGICPRVMVYNARCGSLQYYARSIFRMTLPPPVISLESLLFWNLAAAVGITLLVRFLVLWLARTLFGEGHDH